MSHFIQQLRQRAAGLQKHVIFPEGEDPRIQKAARYLVEEQICSVTLLHSGTLASSGLYKTLNYVDDSPNLHTFIQALREKQQMADVEFEAFLKLLQNPLYYAASMVRVGLADACVAGATFTTSDVIRCAMKTIGVKQDKKIVSSIFLMMMLNEAVFTYADCGVVPYPDELQLADIALESAVTHARLTQTEPRVAMLSFSTKGSAFHERSQLVENAVQIAKKENPDLIIDGELQFDAAFVPEVAARKAPDSVLAGRANVFIFPNLDAANIAYKITERLAGACATGPILQGLTRPMMDLSRGCNYKDIINCACAAILMGDD